MPESTRPLPAPTPLRPHLMSGPQRCYKHFKTKLTSPRAAPSSFGSVARHDDAAYDAAYDAYDDDSGYLTEVSTILSLIGFIQWYIQAFCRIRADRVRVSVL